MITADETIKFIQQHVTDGLVLIIGSGLSAAEGLPGMPALADHLNSNSSELEENDAKLWIKISLVLAANKGLEAALLENPPTPTLETWIVKKTCELIIPAEIAVIDAAIKGEKHLKLTSFLSKVIKPANGIPILSTNYDRLIEVAAEIAGMHVDTTAVGQYAAAFDHSKSFMGSAKSIIQRGKIAVLEHFPRVVVLKPHGSLDWYRRDTGVIRSSLNLSLDRLIITPGLNKYRAGYDSPFDKHRELANNYISSAARLLIIGYGFNDDHLQTHLIPRITGGTPTLILVRTVSEKALEIVKRSSNCICLSSNGNSAGTYVDTKEGRLEITDKDLWDLDIITKEVLT